MDALERSGAACLNLRIHVPGISTDVAREQIMLLGREVVPQVRARRSEKLGRDGRGRSRAHTRRRSAAQRLNS